MGSKPSENNSLTVCRGGCVREILNKFKNDECECCGNSLQTFSNIATKMILDWGKSPLYLTLDKPLFRGLKVENGPITLHIKSAKAWDLIYDFMSVRGLSMSKAVLEILRTQESRR